MIPQPDDLRTIAELEAGSIAETPFAVLLHALAALGKSAVLEIERKPLKKAIVIENGVPVDCKSNLLHETLPRFMVTQGHFTEDQSQAYLTRAAGRGMQFQEALIADEVISASELYKVLQANLARKLLDGFTWRSGHFRVLDQLPEVDSPLKVKVPQLLVTGIGKFAGDEEVNGAVGPLVGKKLFIHPDPPYALDQIRLTRAQSELVELLAAGKRIDELAAETTIPFDKIMRLLYSLAVIGIVVPEDWMPKDALELQARREREARARDGVGTDTMIIRLDQQQMGQPAMAPADAEKLRNRVMETYLRYRGQDSFELLGLEEGASRIEVQDAYIAFSRKFAPWQFQTKGLRSLVEKAEDLFVAGGEAFGELCDADRRNALIQRRRNLREETSKAGMADRFLIKSDLLDPEVQFKKGKQLMQQGQYLDALTQLEFAYDCDPQNGIYRSELAYCRFLHSPSTEAERSLAELQETLRIDPKCGLAMFYAGKVCMETERYDESKTYLERALRTLESDRRPIEALKELQQRSKQKRKRLGGLLGG